MTRKEHELPKVTEDWGWKYHHLGIPTSIKMPNERYLAQFKFYISGFSESPFGIEWMRFDSDSPMHELIQSVPHLAFEVNDLDHELEKHKFELLAEPNSPMDDVRVAMIRHNGAPIELIEFKKKNPDS
ncbi:hypothetical protein DWB61_14215 [Ancylomarina euxinus]|uniref:Uncharacterized protein n=1 Tax=Ancylomarina euxinus TaxID=2283627 RepID=A0A425XY39_9BACT|nr:hypothetical protein [Ancylomarina euxinus]MCZ4695934.1 hypothetical protein [Ancylomarina euxinus]MUP16306.1 hypothetical protein [Ancylomarina euxinus]RRG19703.1 hypothetical protein DWB61_14215 [Ancylomarina euxinus]